MARPPCILPTQARCAELSSNDRTKWSVGALPLPDRVAKALGASHGMLRHGQERFVVGVGRCSERWGVMPLVFADAVRGTPGVWAGDRASVQPASDQVCGWADGYCCPHSGPPKVALRLDVWV